LLRDNLDQIPKEHPIVLISDDGQKAHVALRMLAGSGFERVYNLSGGYVSLERHARAAGYEHLQVGLHPVQKKSVEDLEATGPSHGEPTADPSTTESVDGDGPLVVDVRTPMEFAMGAYPGAIHVSLDEIGARISEIAEADREIILYCASGARSAYGQRILNQMGFTNVRNGGSLHDMMAAGV
jgi:rhodanese-related sulfurtransferase